MVEGTDGGIPVFLLHGFPEWSHMYVPLMKFLGSKGLTSYACNQRGYSPTAAPDDVTDYNYDLLKEDVLAIATELGHEVFHLVGHDHGGVLGWTVATESSRVKSYTSLSVPHVDAFSDGLYGPNADKSQQIASQYFDMFRMKNSASIHGYFWYLALALTSGRWEEYDDTLEKYRPSNSQKAFWWYNGAAEAGKMAMPRAFTASELFKEGQYAFAALRGVYGMPDEPNGLPQTHKSGKIEIPTAFICGSSDTAILCDRPYAYNTKNFVTEDYLHLVVDCGHDLMACKDEEQYKVNDLIYQRILTAGNN